MMQLDVPSTEGVEKITVVDTRKLSASCQLLSSTNTVSVKTLLDYQRQKDISQRYVSEHGTPMSLRTSGARLEPLSEDEAPPLRFLAKPWEERRVDALQQKKERHAEIMLHKYQKMHRKVEGQTSSPLLERALQKYEAMRATEMANMGLESPEDREKKRRLTRRQTLREMKERQKLQARAQKMWKLLRGVTMVFIVYLQHKKRSISIEIAKSFIMQLGEWARVRTATKRLNHRVRLLQRAFRASVTLKRQRCAILSNQWQRVEDNTLQAYFKKYSRKIMDEMQATAEGMQVSPR